MIFGLDVCWAIRERLSSTRQVVSTYDTYPFNYTMHILRVYFKGASKKSDFFYKLGQGLTSFDIVSKLTNGTKSIKNI